MIVVSFGELYFLYPKYKMIPINISNISFSSKHDTTNKTENYDYANMSSYANPDWVKMAFITSTSKERITNSNNNRYIIITGIIFSVFVLALLIRRLPDIIKAIKN